MSERKKAIEVRSSVKKKKPTFKRVQSHQFAKLKKVKWRFPKGMGNKVRRTRRGKPGLPQVGYGSPKLVKGFGKEGLYEVLVYKKEDLAKVGKESIAMIGATVGARKKLEILKEAKSKSVPIKVKDLDAAIKALTKEKKETKKTKEKSNKQESHKQESNKEAPKQETKKERDKQ